MDAIWVMRFRSDGAYLATGGKDGVLRIWKTLDKGGEPSKLFSVYICPRFKSYLRFQSI